MVIISVPAHVIRDQCGDFAVILPFAQHRTRSVFVPALFQPDGAAHNAVGAHQEFQHLVHVADGIGYFPGLDMVIFQDVADGIRGQAAVIIERLAHAPSHHRACYLLEGVLDLLTVGVFALYYLFFKPAHRRD